MTWQEKLTGFVEQVLNQYSERGLNYRYRLTIVDDHNLIVFHPIELEFKHWSKDDLPSHWKDAGRSVIKFIIDKRIESYLSKNA